MNPLNSIRRAVFLVRRDAIGTYWVTLKSPNGETLMHSEGYTRERDAKRAIRAMRLHATVARVECESEYKQ